MKGPRVRLRPTPRSIAGQWDKVADLRDRQIRSGQDISYTRVLIPAVKRLTKFCRWESVLDVGCGTGALTERLASHARSVVGVDSSLQSIALAERSKTRPSNVHYVCDSVEHFAKTHEIGTFTLAVANMMLQDAPNLAGVLNAISKVLKLHGCLVITITHPLFWPEYWNYASAPWFRYDREVAIEAPFTISLEEHPVGWTTHFHRPLQQYFTSLKRSGFRIEQLLEPMPSASVAKLYPAPWRYPRFLALRCRLEPET